MYTKRTTELRPHPKNVEIYNDAIDGVFLQSIQEKGIIQPLLITTNGIIISGHRRWEAARKIGLKEVPVIVSDLTDDLDIIEALIITNKDQRERTNEQMAREYQELKAVESERARRRQLATLNNVGDGLAVVNSPQREKEQETGKARDIAASKLGIGSQKAERASDIIDVIDELEGQGETEEAEELRQTLNEKSVNAAHQKAKKNGYIKPKKRQEKKAPVAKFNATNDNIEWAKWSWNPVTGCKYNCPYCYARDIGNRFNGHFDPEFHADRLSAPQNTKPGDEPGGNAVFVCSMADLFGDWIPTDWIQQVIDQTILAPQWNFLFLTKNPKRLADFDWPVNAWVGTTVDKQARVKFAQEAFRNVSAPVRFLSCEPMNERLDFDDMSMFDWMIVGGRSKSTSTKAFQPEWEWVIDLYQQARRFGLKVYFKPNLTVRPREYPV